MKNEQQSQNLLLKVGLGSTFRNNFLQLAANVFVAGQVNHARWKTGNIDENLQRNNVARQVEGFLYLVFRHLKSCSQDLEKENQQNLCGFENNLQDSFWYYIFEVISLKQRSTVGSVTKMMQKA